MLKKVFLWILFTFFLGLGLVSAIGLHFPYEILGGEFNNEYNFTNVVGTKSGISIGPNVDSYFIQTTNILGSEYLNISTSSGENLIYNSSGSLGIGTVPSTKFHLKDDSGVGTVLATFEGESDSLLLVNDAQGSGPGDYSFVNTQQNNGLAFYDGSGGVVILYNDSEVLKVAGSTGMTVTDTSGVGRVIAKFEGESDSLEILNSGQGDYSIFNSQQDNGIEFRDGNGGIGIYYDGVEVVDVDNSGGLQILSGGLNVVSGASLFESRVNIERGGGSPLILDRTTEDGNLITFRRNGAVVGNIGVNSGTVSYNAFTGSHYGISNDKFETFDLLLLTGENQYFNNNSKSEIIYGVEKSNERNSKRVLGTFGGIGESNDSMSLTNPYLVQAVGNSRVWIIDNGLPVEVGDYLISSDVSGHGMVDDSFDSRSYIFGRIMENVDWGEVDETIDGRKHKLVSISFENMVIDND